MDSSYSESKIETTAPARLQAPNPDDNCDLNPEFAVICSFIAQFGDKLELELNIEQLKAAIEDQSQLEPSLLELHVKLLKKVRRYFVRDQWEKVLIRFAAEYSYEDAYELEQYGYLQARTSIKLQLLSRLMDAQFDCDQKFKNAINLIEADRLRIIPAGRDIRGNTYWQRTDKEGNIRIFQEEPLDRKSWRTVCSNTGQLNELITKLEECKDEKVKGEPPVVKPCSPSPQILPSKASPPRPKSPLSKIFTPPDDGSIELQVAKTIESLIGRVISSITNVFRPFSRNSEPNEPQIKDIKVKPLPKPQKKREKQPELPRRTSSRIQQLQQKKIAEQEVKEIKKIIEPIEEKPSKKNNSTTAQTWRRGKKKRKLSWDKDDSDLSSTSSVTESEESDFSFNNNDDDEFACEDKDTNIEPVIIKRVRTARQSIIGPTDSTIMEEDKPCGRCDKSDDPEWILLCDMCDDGYHTSCCLPPLMMVPDGDWYCPTCEHKMLLIRLKSVLADTNEIIEAKERERMKHQRFRQKTVKAKKVEAPKKQQNDELVQTITEPIKLIEAPPLSSRPEPRPRKVYKGYYSDEDDEEALDDDDDDDYMADYKDDETDEEIEKEEEKLPEKRRRKVINRLNDPLLDLDSTDAESVKSSKPDSDESFQASSATEEEEEEEDLSETEVSEDSTSLDELIASHVKKKKKMKRLDIEIRTRRAASMRVSYKESTDEEDEKGSELTVKSPDDFQIDEDDDDRSTSVSNHSYQPDMEDEETTTTTKNIGEPIIMKFNTSYVDIHQQTPTNETSNAHPSFYEDES